MMLTKNEIARAIEQINGTRPNLVKNVLDGLAQLAQEEIENGNDFVVPGVARLSFRYAPARKKGESYKKGETYVGFGGVEQTAEADSAARKAKVKLVATPAPPIKKSVLPDAKPETTAAFLKTKAGKNVVARKGNR